MRVQGHGVKGKTDCEVVDMRWSPTATKVRYAENKGSTKARQDMDTVTLSEFKGTVPLSWLEFEVGTCMKKESGGSLCYYQTVCDHYGTCREVALSLT